MTRGQRARRRSLRPPGQGRLRIWQTGGPVNLLISPASRARGSHLKPPAQSEIGLRAHDGVPLGLS